jgi:uncharacterized membrane protein YfcA
VIEGQVMPISTVLMLAACILSLAALYSSVGHAGASGYLASMAIVTQMPQDEMKAVALTLNIFVGAIGTWRFVRAGHFDWNTFWPFGLCAIPMAFIGGLWSLPPMVFKPLIGSVLLFAAIILIFKSCGKVSKQPAHFRMPPLPVAFIAGGLLGLLAGLTGTGGGIFLSPLLILMAWSDSKRTAAVSIVFVLANSLAGLGGVIAESPSLPPALPLYICAAVVGGLIGSWFGARRMSGSGIRILLAAVLTIAAVKMFVTMS